MADEEVIQNPDELKKVQEGMDKNGKDTKTLDEVEKAEDILSPRDKVEWDHEAFPNQSFTFVVPSANEYRNAIPNEKLGTSAEGEIQFDPSVIDPLLDRFCKPKPNMDKLSPGQFKALETAFYNFIQSFRRSDAEATG